MADLRPVPSDRQLVDAARAGSDDAWNELVRRHGDAVRVVADVSERTGRDVDAAWASLRSELGADGASTPAQTAVRAVRPRVLATLVGGTYAPVLADGSVPSSADVVDASPAELQRIATAFASLPDDWQTALWHSWVDRQPTATVATHLGRSVAQTRALVGAAGAGLFEALLATEADADVRPVCRTIVPMLGGARRGTLSATHERIVEAHLRGETRHGDPTPCADCRRRMQLASALPMLLPAALVPGITGLDADTYGGVVGAGSAAIGVAALTAQRTERVSRLTRLGAVAAVVAALLGAAFLIRAPLGDLDSRIDDLAGSIPTSDTDGSGDAGSPGASPGGEGAGAAGELPNRIELVFPGAQQGLLYVPDDPVPDLGLELSTPAPVFAGATGTVDAALTNNDEAGPVDVEFQIRPSDGLRFERVTEGRVSCRSIGGVGASCTLDLDPGETREFSFRFLLRADVADRLVVVPNIPAEPLEVPVEFVPDLVAAQVGRGELVLTGNDLGVCDADEPGCVDGSRDSSSAVLDLPPGASVDSAFLLWEGDGAGSADRVVVDPPGGGPSVTVPVRPDVDGVYPPPDIGSGGFVSIADVTDLVRRVGGGTFTVTRRAGATGDALWTLVVITDDGSQPRRLLVVTRPSFDVGPDSELTVSVPVDGSDPPPAGTVRPLVLHLRAAGPQGDHTVVVEGDQVGGDDPFGLAGDASGTAAYDLGIENSPLIIDVSSDDGTVRVAVVAFALDLS